MQIEKCLLIMLPIIGSTMLTSCNERVDKSYCTDMEHKRGRLVADGFSVHLPEGVTYTVKKVSDFSVYKFHHSSNSFLSVYVGNFPDFPKDARKIQKTVVNSLDCMMITQVQSGLNSFDLLIEMPSDFSWPCYLHFWAKSVSEEHYRISQRIINSLECDIQTAIQDSISDKYPSVHVEMDEQELLDLASFPSLAD